MKKLPGFQSLKYLLLAIQTAICTLFSSGNCQTKQEADSIMEFIQNNFYSQGEKSKESLATLYRISREQGDYDLLAEAIYPKSVIRLWVDCPLLSASCSSLRLDAARCTFGQTGIMLHDTSVQSPQRLMAGWVKTSFSPDRPARIARRLAIGR